MKQRLILYRRNGTYYCEDRQTGKQQSLRTRNEAEARALLHSKNEAFRQPILNQQIALAYLSASDSDAAKRAWRFVMDEMTATKQGDTLARYLTAMKDPAFDLILDRPLLETRAEHLLKVLRSGTVSTNVYLRRMHNFALDMNWLPKCVLPKKQWPKPLYKEKRAITLHEHEAIIARELNPERRAFYQLAWHLGAAQTDLATLKAEDVDWEQRLISFFRRKTRSIARLHSGVEVAAVLRTLPATGLIFPYLDHDWNTIFSRWHLLQHDLQIATVLKIGGWMGMTNVCLWVLWRYCRDRARVKESSTAVPARWIRAAR